jgi:hypothetical protein
MGELYSGVSIVGMVKETIRLGSLHVNVVYETKPGKWLVTNRQINISTCPHRVVILNIAPTVFVQPSSPNQTYLLQRTNHKKRLGELKCHLKKRGYNNALTIVGRSRGDVSSHQDVFQTFGFPVGQDGLFFEDITQFWVFLYGYPVLTKPVVLTEKTSSNIKKRTRTTKCHLSSHTILRSVSYPTSFVSKQYFLSCSWHCSI